MKIEGILVVCLVSAVHCVLRTEKRQLEEDWSYEEGATSPEFWEETYSECGGNAQSPINIPSNDLFDNNILGLLPSLEFSYGNMNDSQYVLEGTSHSIKVEVTSEDKTLINAAGLPFLNERSATFASDEFTLAQFHFHWGETDEEGSEHSIDSRFFSMELHLVHWNSGKYDSFDAAHDETDGLLVVAVMIEADTVKSVDELLEPITSRIENGEVEDDLSFSAIDFDLQGLLNSLDTSSYYTYPGSLTTPPCTETVTWVILQNWLSVSPEVTETFRSYANLTKNYRPTQVGSGRRVIDSVMYSYASLSATNEEGNDGNATSSPTSVRDEEGTTGSTESSSSEDSKSAIAIGATFGIAFALLGIFIVGMQKLK